MTLAHISSSTQDETLTSPHTDTKKRQRSSSGAIPVHVCEPLTAQKSTSITEKQSPPVPYSRFHHWWGGNKMQKQNSPVRSQHDVLPSALKNLNHSTQSYTHTHTHWLVFLHLSPRKWVFSLTYQSVSLQHVAMATENLLKGLTASLVFLRVFSLVCVFFFNAAIFANLNCPSPCECMCVSVGVKPIMHWRV